MAGERAPILVGPKAPSQVMMTLSVSTPLDSFASERSARLHPEALSFERPTLGNLETLREPYYHQHTALRAFACRLVGDAASAEDLVHEVFLSIPNAIRNFKGGSSLRTFLIAIAVNMSPHHVRAATR